MDSPPPLPITLKLLGSAQVLAADGSTVPLPSGKPLALLAILARHPEGVDRDTLTQLLWAGTDPAKARASLRQGLFVLRSALGSDVFEGDDPVRIADGAVVTDLGQVEAAIDANDPLTAAALWTEPPFRHLHVPGAPAWDTWADEIRDTLERRLVTSLVSFAENALREGRVGEALDAAQHATRVAPWSDAALHAEFEALLALRRYTEAEQRAATWPDPHAADAFVARIRKLRAREEIPSGGDASTRRTPFVGRESEFARLIGIWRRAEAGLPRVALISGEAGIGKSRLADEVLRVARTEGAHSGSVKGEPGAIGVAWGTLSDLTRQLISMEGAAGISLASYDLLSSILPSMVRRPVNGSSRNAPVDSASPPATEAGYADAFLDLLSAVAEEGPLVLVLDDFGWCDPESRRVIARAVRRLDGVPVLVMATSRSSGSRDSSETTVEELLPGAEAIRLEPWTGDEVQALLSARLGSVSSSPTGGAAPVQEPALPDRDALGAVADRLHEVSGGNPYFTIELLGVLEQNRVFETTPSGGWAVRLDRLPEASEFPGRIEDLLDDSLSRLPPDAARLAGHLALAEQPLVPSVLHTSSALTEGRASSALDVLFDRDIVRWTRDAQVTFTHDEIRAAAERRFGELAIADRRRRMRRRTQFAWGLSAAALVLLVAGTRSIFSMSEDAVPARFGGGEIVIETDDGFIRILPGPGPSHEWQVQPMIGPDRIGRRIMGPYRGPTGSFQWFAWETQPDVKPSILRLGPDGPEEFFRSEGDDYLWDVSADGGLALIGSQPINPSGDYRLDLWLQRTEGASDPVRLYEGVELVRYARFSPDGTRIAFVAFAPIDTLVVMKPSGEVTHRIAMGGIRRPTWCGSEHVVTVVDDDPAERLLEVHLPTGDVRALPPTGFATSHVSCSPDGRGLVYTSAVDGAMSLVLQDRVSGAWELLPVLNETLSTLNWLPSTPLPRPVAAHVDLPDEIPWGVAQPARVVIEDAQGGRTPVETKLTWTSDDPAIAATTPAGVVLANGPGSTEIRATWDGWLSASITATVTGEAPAGGVLQDDFARLDLDRWWIMGTPSPRPVTRDGESVLLLAGDALYFDGLVEREERIYDRGVTVEVDVRIPLNRRDKQWFFLCLVDAGFPENAEQGFERHEIVVRKESCLRYPNANLGNFAPPLGRLHVAPGVVQTLDLSSHFPSDDWVHVALQIRPDGVVSAHVNRENVGTSPVHLSDMDRTRWRVMLIGASWETEVLVRNLRVWEGARY